MGPRVVDHQQVPPVHLGQHPVHGKFVVIFAEASRHVVFVVAGGVLLPHHRNVVVGPVHGRAHQVAGTGVHPDILLVNVLLMNGPGDQVPVRGQHVAAQLRVQGHAVHPGGNQDFLIGPAHALSNNGNVVFRLLRAVGHPHAAGEVDERDPAPRLRLELRRQLEEDAGQGGVIVVGQCVGGQEGVNAELLGPQLLQPPERLRQLGPGHAVLRVAGGVHHLHAVPALPQGEDTAGVVAAANLLRHLPHSLRQGVDEGDVVQVDNAPQAAGGLELLFRGVVGGKHNPRLPGDAAALRQGQLRQGRAVAAAALLMEDFQNGGGRRGLHGEVLPEAGIPGESGL